MIQINFEKKYVNENKIKQLKKENDKKDNKIYLFGDENKPFQFSKVLTFLAVVTSLISILIFTSLSIILEIDNTVVITSIGILGTICVTSLVWSLKKAQAENTTRLYLEMYKEIIKLKKNTDDNQNGIPDAQDFLNDIEENTVSQMRNNLDTVMSDATSLIEKESC